MSYSSIGHLDTLGAWDFERNNKPCEFLRLKVKILLSQLCVGPSQPKLKCQFQKTSHGKIVIFSTCQRYSREVIPLFAQAEGCNTNIGTMTQGKAAKGDNATSLLECFPEPFCTFQEHEHVGCLWFLQNQVWDVGDEYHDDEDPGYRIREIYEAQSCSICMNIMKYHAHLD